MKNARQLLWGILITLISLILILGGVSLSLAEGNSRAKATTSAPTATIALVTPSVVTEAAPTDQLPTDLPTAISTTLPTALPTTQVNPSDTPFVASATSAGLATATTSKPTSTSKPAMTSTSKATASSVSCGAPSGWVTYIVQPGDTLFHLSQVYGVSVAALQKANCMGSSTALKAGQALRVPPGPTRTPVPSPIMVTNTPTFPPLPTSIP